MNTKRITYQSAYRFRRFAQKAYSAFSSMHKVVTIGVLSTCTLSSAMALADHRTDTLMILNHTDTIPETELDELVVTATRATLPLHLVPKQVVLLSSKTIEQSPVRSLQDVLSGVAGVDVMQRGPHGVQADISLRGGSFDQTALLLNGVNLTNPQTGHYSFDIPLNLSDIDHIEVVSGPSALAYGSSAMAGAINVVTKTDPVSSLSATVEGGYVWPLGHRITWSLQ